MTYYVAVKMKGSYYDDYYNDNYFVAFFQIDSLNKYL